MFLRTAPYPVKPLRFILPVFLLALTAFSGNAQDQTVRFPQRKTTVRAVFEQIEKQTDYLISYNRGDLNTSRNITLTSTELTVGEALSQALSRQKREYTVRGSHIIILPARKNRSSQAHTPIMPSPAATTYISPEAEIFIPEFTPVDISAGGVDTDSLSIALTARSGISLTEIPAEPYLNTTLYYRKRLADGFVPTGNRDMTKAALRINLLYGAFALAPNISAEVGIGPRSTVTFGSSYNGWNKQGSDTNNKSLRHWTVSAEYRYWLCERFNGHFFGAHGLYGYYNISGKKIPMILEKDSDKYRYKGNVLGAGVSYGYQLMISRKWSVEFNAGVGFGRMKYDKSECERCGELVGKDVTRNFFSPTRLGITLVYIIK